MMLTSEDYSTTLPPARRTVHKGEHRRKHLVPWLMDLPDVRVVRPAGEHRQIGPVPARAGLVHELLVGFQDRRVDLLALGDQEVVRGQAGSHVIHGPL